VLRAALRSLLQHKLRLSLTLLAVVVGVAAWAAFGVWLHGPLIGVRPFA